MTPILTIGSIYKSVDGVYYEYRGIVLVKGRRHLRFDELLQEGIVFVPLCKGRLEKIELNEIV